MSHPQVEGSKVRLFGSKENAQRAARALGWPVKCVARVQTKFCVCWALGTGVDSDPYTNGAFVSREWFSELGIARNGRAVFETMLDGA